MNRPQGEEGVKPLEVLRSNNEGKKESNGDVRGRSLRVFLIR